MTDHFKFVQPGSVVYKQTPALHEAGAHVEVDVGRAPGVTACLRHGRSRHVAACGNYLVNGSASKRTPANQLAEAGRHVKSIMADLQNLPGVPTIACSNIWLMRRPFAVRELMRRVGPFSGQDRSRCTCDKDQGDRTAATESELSERFTRMWPWVKIQIFPPVNIFIPTKKPKIGGAPNPPKMGSRWF